MRRRLGEKGLTALEFAMLAPVVAVAFAGALEFVGQATVAAALDMGARRASRVGITGAVAGVVVSDSARLAALRQAVLDSVGGVLRDPSKLTIDETSSDTTSNITYDPTKPDNAGGPGSFVRYDLSYTQKRLTIDLIPISSLPASFTHKSTVLVKNEPFPK